MGVREAEKEKFRRGEGERVLALESREGTRASPSFPSQPEGKIGLPRANPRGRLMSPS